MTSLQIAEMEAAQRQSDKSAQRLSSAVQKQARPSGMPVAMRPQVQQPFRAPGAATAGRGQVQGRGIQSQATGLRPQISEISQRLVGLHPPSGIDNTTSKLLKVTVTVVVAVFFHISQKLLQLAVVLAKRTCRF